MKTKNRRHENFNSFTDLSRSESKSNMVKFVEIREPPNDARWDIAAVNVEFGPLLAFTACLMNFEKLAHGSPQ